MTSDEIKKMYSMRDILMRYGIQPNRAGFIRCPFHKEKTASMKIYKDSYYCFGCGASGDIFDFVCRMDGLTFREAFLSMGGTYEKETFRDRTARYHAQKQRDQRQRQANDLEVKRKLNNDLIDIYRDWYQRSEPFSGTWTDCYNALQYQLYLHSILNGLG